jgi:hypothetical protein
MNLTGYLTNIKHSWTWTYSIRITHWACPSIVSEGALWKLQVYHKSLILCYQYRKIRFFIKISNLLFKFLFCLTSADKYSAKKMWFMYE